MKPLDPQQQAARDWFESLRSRICDEFEAIEREAGSDATFEFIPWDRFDEDGSPGGGGVRGMVRMARATERDNGGGALMDLGLEGKVALVTAGSKGIGRGIADALSAEGAKVAVTSRSTERAEAVAGEIGGCGYAFDANDLDAIPGLIERVEADLGPIEIYVANTGGPPAGDPLSFSRADWESAQRTLLLAPTEIIQRVLPGMR